MNGTSRSPTCCLNSCATAGDSGAEHGCRRVEAELTPGVYRVTFSKPGFGAKRVELTVPLKRRTSFACFPTGSWGYAWPKWVRAGEKSEFRVHSPEAYKILAVAVWLEEGARPQDWLVRRAWSRRDAANHARRRYSRTGVEWNKFGYASPHHKQLVEALSVWGCISFTRRRSRAGFSHSRGLWPPQKPGAPIAVLASNITWNAYNNFGGRSNYIHADRLPPTPTVNARLELNRYTDPQHLNYDTVDYAPLSFDRPEPINHVPESTEANDPIEGRAACHIAPAEWRLLGLAGARGIRLRLLRGDAISFRPTRSRPLQGADLEHASRVLVADDVRSVEVVGLRARRKAVVPGWKRAQLRRRFFRRVDVHLSQRRCPPACASRARGSRAVST